LNRTKLYNSIFEISFDSDDIFRDNLYCLYIYENSDVEIIKKEFINNQNVVIRSVQIKDKNYNFVLLKEYFF